MLTVACIGAVIFPMRSVAQQTCCSLLGAPVADRYRVTALAERRFSHAELWRALEPLLEPRDLRVVEIGRSIQNRAIRAVTFGTGPIRVLLWSQMHGDESTATLALADILRFFSEGGDDPLRRLLHDRLEIVMVPMLNPDGAERFQRYDAAGVDVNRDARRLATPEARALKSLRDSTRPAFGFNLHDQGARTTAGPGGDQVAIALLAPAADSARTYGAVRARARQVAAVLATALDSAVPGRFARYDDTFEPRAFGDLMQAWGTSTVLIESGALPDDPEKQALRRLNVALILTALEAIATERYVGADADRYERLPFNHRLAYDVLVLGGRVVLPSGDAVPLDLALVHDDPVARRGFRLGDIGDLAGATAMDTVDASGLYLRVSAPSVGESGPWWLLRDEPVAIVFRRGSAADAPEVRRLPE
jgi:hypothetical protein